MCIRDSFLTLQINQRNRKAQGRRYSSNDRSFASALHYCSSKSYRFMQKHFSLPSTRSLRNWLQNAEVEPGVNKMVLSLLEIKAKKMKREEKVVSLVFDEISIKSSLSYDFQQDRLEGYEDFGGDTPVQPITAPTRQQCNQAMVFMIKGLYLNYKQIIGYFLTSNAMAGHYIKELVLFIVNQLQAVGLVPKAVVCDQGSNNIKVRKLLGVTAEKPFIQVNGENTYFFHDPPHLIKSVRNNLKKYDFVSSGKVCSWSYIREFYNKDSKMIPRLAPKLTKKCVTLPPFSNMRVCLATRALSHSVASGILVHVSFNSLEPSAANTAEFIEMCDTLCDIFNSSTFSSPKEYRRPISNDSRHMQKLDEICDCLKKLEVLNNRKGNPLCIQGWVDNISALKLLWSELHDHFDFRYLLTRRITQDCIENIFSIIRAKGGNNVTPDAIKFRSAIRGVMVNQLLCASDDSNCESDAANFLLTHNDVMKCNFKANVSKQCDLNDQITDYDYDVVQENAEHYVMGWACSKFPHAECRNVLSSYDNDYSMENVHIEMKKYDDNSKMLFPNEYGGKLAAKMSEAFENNFCQFLLESTHGIRNRLTDCFSSMNECSESICNTCMKLLTDKYFNVLIKAYVNRTNDLSEKRLATKNIKLNKILHV